MTDGSSQGLFVVVAVVIFGIFVAISYTLFEDNLRPALASMFMDSIEQATKSLNNKRNLIDFNTLFLYGLRSKEDGAIYKDTETVYIKGYSGTGDSESLVIPYTVFEHGKNYIMEFDMEVLSGEIQRLGGHLWFTTLPGEVYVNDSLMENVYNNPISRNVDNFSKGVIVNLTEGKYKIKVLFDTNAYNYSMENDVEVNKNAFIKPNRDRLKEYEVLISNLNVYEN